MISDLDVFSNGIQRLRLIRSPLYPSKNKSTTTYSTSVSREPFANSIVMGFANTRHCSSSCAAREYGIKVKSEPLSSTMQYLGPSLRKRTCILLLDSADVVRI